MGLIALGAADRQPARAGRRAAAHPRPRAGQGASLFLGSGQILQAAGSSRIDAVRGLAAAAPGAGRRCSALGLLALLGLARRSACSPANSASPGPGSRPASAGRSAVALVLVLVVVRRRAPATARHACCSAPPAEPRRRVADAARPAARRRRWSPGSLALRRCSASPPGPLRAACCDGRRRPSPERRDTRPHRRRRARPSDATARRSPLGRRRPRRARRRAARRRLPARPGRRPRRPADRPPARRVPVHRRRPGPARRTAPTHSTATAPRVPSLAALSFPAGRFEREMRDLFGIVPVGHPLPRRLVRHHHWPARLVPDAPRRRRRRPPFGDPDGPFPFVTVEGPGVYEIPVGPVHAGLIEPGHFRFSVVGETILKLKARLWFVHKGIEKLFEGRTPADGAASWPNGSAATPRSATPWPTAWPSRTPTASRCRRGAQRGRAVLLELERLYNHVTDIGALCNDVGYGILQRPRPAHPRTAAAPQRRGHRAPAAARRRHPRRRATCAPLPDPAALRRHRRRHRRDRRPRARPQRRRATGSPAPPCSPAGRPATSARSATSPGPAASTIDARRDHPFADLGAVLTVADPHRRRRAGPVPGPRRGDRRLHRR